MDNKYDYLRKIDRTDMNTIEYLVLAMYIGEEIEVYIEDSVYFLQPDYERKSEEWPAWRYTVVYDCTDFDNAEKIFVGSPEEVIEYVFNGKYTLKKDYNKFKLVW